MIKKKKRVDEDDPYKTNLEKNRDKLKETAGDERWWKPKPNTKNIIRILPPWGKSANGAFFFTAGLHYNFKIGGRKMAIPCNRTRSKDERCLVCEFCELLKSSGSEDLEKLVSGNQGIRSKRKYWVNLIDRKYPDEVKMYGGSKKFMQTLQDALDDDDFGDITDVEEGYDVRCNRVGAGFTDTRYTFSVRPKPSPLGMDDWKDKVYDLSKEVVQWLSLPEQAKIMRANYPDELGEVGFKFNLPNEPKNKKKQEDDDEDGEDSDDDDEEEEAPKKKSPKTVVKKKKAVEKDDEDDDDDIEESGDSDDDDEDDDDEED